MWNVMPTVEHPPNERLLVVLDLGKHCWDATLVTAEAMYAPLM